MPPESDLDSADGVSTAALIGVLLWSLIATAAQAWATAGAGWWSSLT